MYMKQYIRLILKKKITITNTKMCHQKKKKKSAVCVSRMSSGSERGSQHWSHWAAASFDCMYFSEYESHNETVTLGMNRFKMWDGCCASSL